MESSAAVAPGTAERSRPARPRVHILTRRVALVVVIWALSHAAVELAGVVWSSVRNPGALTGPGSFFLLLAHWDSENYANVAQYGYFAPQSLPFTQAFLPGYPLVSRFLAEAAFITVSPTPLEIAIAMWTVTAAASLGSAILLWRLVLPRFGPATAVGAVVLMLAGPYALFLVASYPEGLYLVPALGAWLAMRDGRWLLAGVLTALAGTIRIETVFLAVALVVLFALRQRRLHAPWVARALGFVVVGSLGVVWYFAWLWRRTGDPLAWFHAEQTAWHRSTHWPWQAFERTLTMATSPEVVRAGHIQAWMDIVFACLYVLGVVVLIARRWWPEAVYVGLATLSMITSYAFTSIARESTVQFPLMVLVASTLRSRRWRWVFWVVAVLGILVVLAQSARFSVGDWSD
ncbi:mannosyltransferase family protein [Curtobacterium ammoniigenes]|uniref:mannosyltransferase family protein n=1 Tax=Curtobacterium ammoniigenes TaxID=395387 RepID=UPI00082FC4D6|nr:mannosyltransferase family protein [Curtobacterium ammoniigenes]